MMKGLSYKSVFRRCCIGFPRLRNHGDEAIVKVWVKGNELEMIRRRVVGKVVPGRGFCLVVGVRGIRTARRMRKGEKGGKLTEHA
jgi:hypothetical protein